jgi:hypothetical protein
VIDAYFYWNIVALVGLTPLLTSYMNPMLRWGHFLFGLVCAAAVVANFTLLPINTLRGTTDFGSAINYGWDEVRSHVLGAQKADPADLIGATRYSTTSQLGFALGLKNPVRFIPDEQSDYLYWTDPQKLAGKSGLILVDDHDGDEQEKQLRPLFATLTEVDRFPIIRFGRTIYAWRIYRGDGFKP